jgi:hypothetical protein
MWWMTYLFRGPIVDAWVPSAKVFPYLVDVNLMESRHTKGEKWLCKLQHDGPNRTVMYAGNPRQMRVERVAIDKTRTTPTPSPR